MYNQWEDERFAAERRARLLREWENERLYRQMRASQRKRAAFYRRILLWLGRRFVAWGQRLEETYTTPVVGNVPGAQTRA